jgi:Tfp pilus assembly protein PilN
MKRVRLDFAPPSVARSLFHTRPAAWALTACALLLCLASAALGWQMLASKRAFDAQLAARQRASAPAAAPVQAAGPAISATQAAAINGAVLQLNLPWRALHDAIGAATPRSIALLALEPDARKRTMRITAEAKTSDDMIAYVEQLKQQELFAAVVLTRHEINDQDPNKPIRFQLDAQWMAP